MECNSSFCERLHFLQALQASNTAQLAWELACQYSYFGTRNVVEIFCELAWCKRLGKKKMGEAHHGTTPRLDVQANSDYTKLFVPQLPPDVYAALADPWGTHPDDLLAAVNAARVMPRAQVSHATHSMRAKGKAGKKNSLTNVRLR